MELQHINITLPVEGDLNLDLVRFIDVFHRWVGEQSLGELLIDVADYRHVGRGPLVALIGHEADYSIDLTDGRYGLRYGRKATLAGSNDDRLKQAWWSAAHVCELLEAEFSESGLKFSRTDFELTINDRALAPNKPNTYGSCREEIESFLRALWETEDFSLETEQEPRKLFGLKCRVDGKDFDLDKLLERTATASS